MPLTPPLSLRLGRFKQLPQRSMDVWQGGVVKLPAWVENPEAPEDPPVRPMAGVWVSRAMGLVHVVMPEGRAEAGPDVAIDAFLEFGIKFAKHGLGRPAVVEVRDARLADALRSTLSGTDTTVVVVDDLPLVAAMLRAFEQSQSDVEPMPALIDTPDLTLDDARTYASAAARFYAATPWRHLTNDDLVVAASPAIPDHMQHLVVLGHGGQEFGVAFFDSRAAFENFVATAEGRPPQMRARGITFESIDRLPFSDVDLWEEHGLPAAGPSAYPLALELGLHHLRRFNAIELRAATVLLDALAATTEDELDRGRWQKTVPAPDGPVRLSLSLPHFLDAESGVAPAANPAVMPRAAERASAQIARLLEGRPFASVDDANRALEDARRSGRLDGPLGAGADRRLTPRDQAQELAYDAFEATGRRRTALARRAITLWPDCADAYVILGDESLSPEEAHDWYVRGVEAGARAIGDRFDELAGEFWGHLETRPYMRARLNLAQCLIDLGQTDEGIDHLQALLRLNPNDNQGVRHVLLPVLLDQGRPDDADRLISAYEDDVFGLWIWARTLRAFETDGDSARARSLLTEATEANAHVARFLLDPDSLPDEFPPYFSIGSREEAASVADALGNWFDRLPGGKAWLRSGRKSGGQSRKGTKTRGRRTRR